MSGGRLLVLPAVVKHRTDDRNSSRLREISPTCSLSALVTPAAFMSDVWPASLWERVRRPILRASNMRLSPCFARAKCTLLCLLRMLITILSLSIREEGWSVTGLREEGWSMTGCVQQCMDCDRHSHCSQWSVMLVCLTRQVLITCYQSWPHYSPHLAVSRRISLQDDLRGSKLDNLFSSQVWGI